MLFQACLNKCIKKLEQVICVTADLGRVTLDLAQFNVGLDKRIKTLEGGKEEQVR